MMLWLLRPSRGQRPLQCRHRRRRAASPISPPRSIRALGREPGIEFVDTPAEIRDKYQYFTEARMDRLRAAGYDRPTTSLEDGVARLRSDLSRRAPIRIADSCAACFSSFPYPAIDPGRSSLIGPLAIRWYALAYIAGLILGWRYCLRLAKRPPRRRDAAGRSTISSSGRRSASCSAAGSAMCCSTSRPITSRIRSRSSRSVARRHVVPWRRARRHRRDHPVLPRSAADRPLRLRRHHRLRRADRPVLRPHRQFHQWRAVGPRRPTCRGRWSSRRGGPVPRHPSQLYEAGLEGIVLFLVLVCRRRFTDGARDARASLTGVFLIGYGVRAHHRRVLPRARLAPRLPVVRR